MEIFVLKKLLSFILSLFVTLSCCIPVSANTIKAPATKEVGVLTIFSSNDTGSSSSLDYTGHTFLAYENTTNSRIKLGGIYVAAGEEITFGTWGNKSQHKGIWYNLELYGYKVHNAYKNRVSLSLSITIDELEKINSFIKYNDTWSINNNCSTFSVRIWNDLAPTSKDLNAGLVNTPTNVMNSIKSKNGYETKRSIETTDSIGNIGYMKNGSFVSVSMKSMMQSLSQNGAVKFNNSGL